MHDKWWNTNFNVRHFKAAAIPVWIAAATTAASIGSQQYTASKARTQAKKQADALAGEQKRIEGENKAALAKAASDVAGAEKQAKASVAMRNRARARSKTVYTSPLGATTQAATVRKSLLGQ